MLEGKRRSRTWFACRLYSSLNAGVPSGGPWTTQLKKKRKAPTFVCVFLSSCISSWSGRVSSAPLFFFFLLCGTSCTSSVLFSTFPLTSSHLLRKPTDLPHCERILTYVCTYIVFFFFLVSLQNPLKRIRSAISFFSHFFLLYVSVNCHRLFLWSFFQSVCLAFRTFAMFTPVLFFSIVASQRLYIFFFYMRSA